MLLGLVLDVSQTADIAVPPESAEEGWVHDGSTNGSAIRICGIQTKGCGAPALLSEKPLLLPLQQFDRGTLVVYRGRLGSVCSGKVDYVIKLDSGHEFTQESG